MDDDAIDRRFAERRKAQGLPAELPPEAFTIAASILRTTKAGTRPAPDTTVVPSTAAPTARKERRRGTE